MRMIRTGVDSREPPEGGFFMRTRSMIECRNERRHDRIDEIIEVQLDYEYIAACGCKVSFLGSDTYENAVFTANTVCDVHAGFVTKRVMEARREARNQLIAEARDRCLKNRP